MEAIRLKNLNLHILGGHLWEVLTVDIIYLTIVNNKNQI